MTRKRIIILVAILVVGFLLSFGASFFLGNSSKNQQTQLASNTKLEDVKCQAGLLAPTVDSRACSFKDIAASEIERRKLCNKDDAKAALDIACQEGFKPPSGISIPSASQTPTGPTQLAEQEPETGSPSAQASNCTVKALSANDRFIQNKSLACGQFSELAADEFFKNPNSGCKSKEEALAIVKKACSGDTQEATQSASTGTPLETLADLVNCKSISASITDLIKKQPTLCSSASNIPAEYVSCTKEIIETVTPVCLGLGQGKPTTNLSGATTNNQGQLISGSTECPAASSAITSDPRACQFKDLAAQELSNRNLCTKDAAKSALEKVCGSTSPSTSGEKVCNGVTVSADSEFQQNKSLACSAGKSVAIQRIMGRTNSPCKTEAEASKALDEACNGTSSSGGTGSTGGGTTQNPTSSAINCNQISDDLAAIVKNNRELCTTAQAVPDEYKDCSKDISNKVALACTGSGSTQSPSSTTCQGSLVVQNPRFQQNKALACGSEVAKATAIETIKTTPGSPCKTDAQAAQALEEACELSGFGGGSTSSPSPSNSSTPGANECKAFSDSMFSTVSKNPSLCTSPIPDQFKSCSDLIIKTLAPICDKNPQPTAGAKCDGATVAKDSQFLQSRDLACGVGRSVAEQTIATRTDSPCKGNLEAAKKALDEACNLTGTGSPTSPTPSPTSSSTTVCNGAVVAADSEFQSNKALACTSFRSVAIQKVLSRANSPCKSEAQASNALDEACAGTTSTTTSPPSNTNNQNSTSNTTNNSQTGSNNQTSNTTGCTCSNIASNPDFQQNSALACANPSIAAEQIATRSEGRCSAAQAAIELEKICNNQCTDPSGNATSNIPLYKIGSEPSQIATGDGSGSTASCTCQAIAANAEFQKNSGLACQFKSQAVSKIVESSQGRCDSTTAATELEKICSNACTDSMGQKITPANSEGQGGVFGSFLNTIKSIPIIGDFAEVLTGGASGGGGFMDMFRGFTDGGGGFEIPIISDLISGGGEGGFTPPSFEDFSGGNGGGFNLGGMVEQIVDTVTGFFGGLF